MMRRLVIFSVTLSLLLTACGSKESGPKRGGTLRIGSADKLVYMPWEATTVDQLSFASLVYRSLTTVTRSGEVKPGLARSWSLSGDKKEWDFVLDPTAKFANGKHITPQDVKYSIEKTSAKGSVSSSATVLSVVSGFITFHDGKATSISGIQTVGNATLRVKLDEPWADLPTALAAPAFGITAAKATTPITSGPFRIDQKAGDSVVLTSAVPNGTYVDQLKWQTYGSESALADAYGNDHLDIALGTGTADESSYTDYAAMLFYGMNERATSLNNKQVRQAILRAIDRNAIVRKTYAGRNLETNGVIPVGFPGWVGNACGATCTYDQKKAKSLLANVKDQELIHIDIDDTKTQKEIAEEIKAALTAVGLKSEFRVHKAAEYPAFLQSGKQELFQAGRVPEFLSPDAVLWPLYSSGSPDNVTGLHNDAIDQQLQLARATSTFGDRVKRFSGVEKAALAEATTIPLAQVRRAVSVSSDVEGFSLSIMGTFDATKVWLQ